MKQSERFEKISELLQLDKFEKGERLYIHEVFKTDGSIGDRADLLLDKLGVHEAGFSIDDKDIISENLETLLEMYDGEKPVDFTSVDFHKWNSLSEAVKKSSKIDMKTWKWTDSTGAERAVNEGSSSSYINQSFWNDAHKRIYLTQENVVEYSNYHGISKGDKLEISDIQRLKTKGHQIVYTK